MDLGLAPRRLGFGVTSAWVWRHVGLGSAPYPFGLAPASVGVGAAAQFAPRSPQTFTATINWALVAGGNVPAMDHAGLS
jgi:hypothetical protein